MGKEKKDGNKGEKVCWTRGGEGVGDIVIDAQRILWKIEEFLVQFAEPSIQQRDGTENAKNELMKGSN